MPRRNKLLAGIVAVFAISVCARLLAIEQPLQLDIESKNAGSALLELGERAGVQIMIPPKLGKTVRLTAIKGEYTLRAALDYLLYGSGLSYKFIDANSVVIGSIQSSGVDLHPEKATFPVAQTRVTEEMIIVASKHNKDIQDLSGHVTTGSTEPDRRRIDSVELENRKIDTLEDLGMAVPELSVTASGSERRFSLRGIGNLYGWTAPLVGLYMDNVSVTANPTWMPDLRLYDVELVEVLKGPQGTLYGDGSVGGTVRFVTKKPELDSVGGKMDASVSTIKGGSQGHKLQGVVNIPLIENELAFRIVGTVEREGGWIDQPAASLRDVNSQNARNFRIKSLWTPEDSLQISLSAITHRNHAGKNTGEDSHGNFTQAFDQLTTPKVTNRYSIYDLSVNYDFGSFNLVSSTNYIHIARQLTNSRRYLPGGGISDRPLEVLTVQYPQTTRAISQEIRIASAESEVLGWTVGAFYRDRSVNQIGELYMGYADGLGTLPPLASHVDEQKTRSLALFGNVSFNWFDRWEFGLGLRHFYDDRTQYSGAVSQAGDLSFSSQTGAFSSITPRLFVSYDVTDRAKAYSSIAKGFRSGGFNRFGFAPFGPEKVWTYDLGVKLSLFDGTLASDVAIFCSEYDNFQIAVRAPLPNPPVGITNNAGNARIVGVEWDFAWRASDHLSISFSGNIVDAEIVDFFGVFATHKTGDGLDMVPDNSYALSTTYDMEIANRPVSFRVDYSRSGKMSRRDRTIIDFDDYEHSDVISMLNASVDWRWTNLLSVGFYATNLLNDRGFTTPFSYGFDVENNASRSRPRTVGFKLGVEF